MIVELEQTISGDSPSLTLDEVAFSHSRVVLNLETLLDSQLLLKEEVAAAAKALVHLQLGPHLHLFLDQEALCTVTHFIVISLLKYYNGVHKELSLKSTWKFWLV